MDHTWAAAQLEEFRETIDLLPLYEVDALDEGHDDLIREHGSRQDVVDRLMTLEPVMKDLMNAAKPNLGEYPEYFTSSSGYERDLSPDYWRTVVRPRVLQGIGIHTLGAEASVRLRPDSPDLVADQFHPWVWDAAMPLWQAGSKQEAIQAAARSVNARLQQKLNRRDIADAALCREAFSFNDPTPDRSRLRFPGDRTSETWRSRQKGGIDFGAGCFEGIRNPASHEHDLNMSDMVALEQLAAFSVLARWIGECIVVYEESNRSRQREG